MINPRLKKYRVKGSRRTVLTKYLLHYAEIKE